MPFLLSLCVQADEKAELSTRAKGDVVANLLPLVDNFELARTQVKAETEAEQKINNSYQVRKWIGMCLHATSGPCGQQCCMQCYCCAVLLSGLLLLSA